MSIPSAEYRQRRERFMARLGNGVAVIRSAPTAVMHNDVDYPYRQDSDFFYLSGFDEPDAALVLAPHCEQQFVMFVQPRDPHKEAWTGYLTGVEGAKERFGADEAYPIGELDEQLPQYLESADRIYYHLGRDRAFNDKILGHWQRLMARYPRRGTGPVAIEDTKPIFHALRSLKSATELAMVRQAVAISAEAHERARSLTQPGRYEYEIQAAIESTFRSRGAFGPAYPTIVASGANACILHYIENQRQMQAQDLLLIDAGCAYGYYNADITRTFPVGRQFSPEQKAIYELVLEAQAKAIAQIQPGCGVNEFHDAAVRVLVEGLRDLGILSGSTDELMEQETYKPLFMHRTGHWIGLDVHDAGLYKQDRDRWQTLQPGHVLTVEPGLYIGPNLALAEGQPAIAERWRGIGVRIEDDVAVTANGPDVLSAEVPKSVAAMEA